MKIFLFRHGKSDKSLEAKLPHAQFEFLRPLHEGEVEKAKKLGRLLTTQVESLKGFDFVWSGKMRSMQTVAAVAEGLGVPSSVVQTNLREDFGLSYLAEKEYWEAAERSIKSGMCNNHADFFLNNPPTGQTFGAEYIRSTMRAVIRRAIERNTFLGNEIVVMVSHEPVISLCMSDLTDKTVTQLGGQCSELEYAVFTIQTNEDLLKTKVVLTYRNENVEVSEKIFSQ